MYTLQLKVNLLTSSRAQRRIVGGLKFAYSELNPSKQTALKRKEQ